MDRNPYSPPSAPVADAPGSGSGALYSPRQIYLASFLGSPVAAAWFIHQNFMALGRESSAFNKLGLGFALTIALCVAGAFLPRSVPSVLVPIAYSSAIYQYAKFLFQGDYDRRLAAGGSKGSWWRVVGVSLLVSVIGVGIVVAVVLAVPGSIARR